MAFRAFTGPREFQFYNGQILPMNSYQRLGPGWRKWVTGSRAFLECASSVGPLSAPISQSPWGERDCLITLSVLKFDSGEIWTGRANWQQAEVRELSAKISLPFSYLSSLIFCHGYEKQPTHSRRFCFVSCIWWCTPVIPAHSGSRPPWTLCSKILHTHRHIHTHIKQTNKQNPTWKALE